MPSDSSRTVAASFACGALFGLGLALSGMTDPAVVLGFLDIAGRWNPALAGALVGFGTRVSGGCTSGHGVCGLGRFSARSLVAVIVFMAAGMAATYVMRHVL